MVCALVQFEAARVEEELAELEGVRVPNAGHVALTRRGVLPPHLAALINVVVPLLPRFQRSAAAALTTGH